MKAWITIYAMVFAAGLVTVLAQETKTNAPAGATASAPANHVEVAVPPAVTTTSAPPSGAAREAKPPAAAPASQSNSVPTHSNVITSPKNSGNANKTAPANPPAVITTSTPASTIGNEEPPTGETLTPTNAVSAESETTAGTQTQTNAVPASPESSGLETKWALAIGAVILVVAGVAAAFMLRHYRVAPHGSLITSAMAVSQSEAKDGDKDDDKDDDKPGEKHGEKREEKKPEKKEEKKFPPPMT